MMLCSCRHELVEKHCRRCCPSKLSDKEIKEIEDSVKLQKILRDKNE